MQWNKQEVAGLPTDPANDTLSHALSECLLPLAVTALQQEAPVQEVHVGLHTFQH